MGKGSSRPEDLPRRERYLVYELLPGGDVNSRLNKDARQRMRFETLCPKPYTLADIKQELKRNIHPIPSIPHAKP